MGICWHIGKWVVVCWLCFFQFNAASAQIPDYVHLQKVSGNYVLLPELYLQPKHKFHATCDCTPPTATDGRWKKLNDSTVQLDFIQRSNHLYYEALQTEAYPGGKDSFYLEFEDRRGKPLRVEIKPESGVEGFYTSDANGVIAVSRDSFLLFGRKLKVRNLASDKTFLFSDIIVEDSSAKGYKYTLDKPKLEKKMRYILVRKHGGSYELWDANGGQRLGILKEV